jgi:protein-L-isoaspartate(D-aspartate) O-methyltransferase
MLRRSCMFDKKEYAEQCAEMIEKQLRRRGVVDAAVLAAMMAVPRHEFVPVEMRSRAYGDLPLPIGSGQTISQPYMVAAMTAALKLQPNDRVLEIGTGCGYHAAVLSRLAKDVFSIERRPELASAASNTLLRLGYANAHVHCGDGTLGLPELGPFNAILVAAAAPAVPKPLLLQLADGGRMILPVGNTEHQELQFIERHGDAFPKKLLEGCRFVPLVGYHGWQESS